MAKKFKSKFQNSRVDMKKNIKNIAMKDLVCNPANYALDAYQNNTDEMTSAVFYPKDLEDLSFGDWRISHPCTVEDLAADLHMEDCPASPL